MIFSACSLSDRQAVDKLNDLSYAYHYRSLDSTEHYAREALSASPSYHDGRAEALNNLAFVHIARMQYEDARMLLDEVPEATDNQLELLISYILQMRLCQRMSSNRAFYDYREMATRTLRRINEERSLLDRRQQQRLVYAESELAIVTSTYFYYVGMERQSANALYNMPANLQSDTAQYLNYLYNVGSGGMVTADTQDEINQVEFDHLMRCYLLAHLSGNVYFAANSLEALAEHLMVADYREKLMHDNLPAFKYFNPDEVSTDSLPMDMARRSLEIFSDYGDVYQIAGAHRTLASCYLQDDNYEQALMQLHLALADTTINKAPDLVASIREQLSVAYAAIDDKPSSDNNRNIYLDLQEQTRQDRYLEARAGQLEHEASQLNFLIWAVVAVIVLLILMVLLFFYRRRKSGGTSSKDHEMLQQQEELKEQLAMARLRVERSERLALEQRAKISLVNNITPLIDRIIHEANRLNPESKEYISELTDNINEQNDVLTHWIQMRQGELSLHIETFPLQLLFDIVAKSRSSFGMKHIQLEVEPTTSKVKADKVLTLFMLNTLADNARKFTAEGGSVRINAVEADDYVEISVSDTGTGMDAEQLAHVFDRKMAGGHGFGLLNCKGIIEKYRKMSKIFSVCLLSAESRLGEGSRFFFRLPKGILRLLLPLMLVTHGLGPISAQTDDNLRRASSYADSAYYSNINSSFENTLAYADSCRYYLNHYYRSMRPGRTDTLLSMGDLSLLPSEILWYRDSVRINYEILLTIRNESAVAALALHQWTLYQYNNRIYTQLFKEMSSDNTLADYCRTMQQSQTNKQIAIILLLLLVIIILVAVVWQVLVSIGQAARRQQEQQDRLELMHDEVARVEQEEAALHVSNAVLDNCLSTLKHETMYYPSRIRQLIDSGDDDPLPEVAAYYRELYGILSQQAMRQTEHVRLHLQPLDHDILGDGVLIDYLFEILRKQSGNKQLDISYQTKDDKYVVSTVHMPLLQLSERQASALFTPANDNIPFLLCRQIVRDHGEATNRRGCAIRAEVKGNGTDIIIVLPRATRINKTAKK
ncbi:MAG: DUF5112 domain-containing protein [Prevotella sp.]|nr:DUF5112 domain-containing protein [Prevotella sp.]